MDSAVAGVLPDSIGNFSELVALSLVGTSITGSLPASIGNMPALKMVWLDHNPKLGGAIPASFANLKGLVAFELHFSGFSGKLPALPFETIPDCTLNGLTFDCPLPKNAFMCGAACK